MSIRRLTGYMTMGKSPTRDAITDLFVGFGGQKNTLTIQRPYIAFCQGDHLAALLLSQILYWTDRTDDPDGWFVKSYDEWQDELYMTQYQVSRAINGDKRAKNGGFALKDVGVETKLKSSKFHAGAATLHYRIDMDALTKAIHAFLGLAVINNVDNGVMNNVDNLRYQQTQYTPINNVDNSYTEITTETTTEIIASVVTDAAQLGINSSSKSDASAIHIVPRQTPTPISAEPPSPLSMYDAILKVWGYSGGLNGDMQKMLEGTATKRGWKEYNVMEPLTANDLITWSDWYKRTELKGRGDFHMIEQRGKVQSSINKWRAAGQPKATRVYAHPSHKPIDPDEHITAADEAQILANMPPEARAAFEKTMKAWTS